MFCPNCGREVVEGSNFCVYCRTKLVSEREVPPQEAIRNVLIRRIEGIRNRDAKAIETVVYKEKYSKFDDWPPFEIQGQESLKSEADALKALKEYSYETRGWRIEIFGDSAMAAFTIRYRGQVRDLIFNIQSRVTAILAKDGDEWKIVHEHWSRFPTPRPAAGQGVEEKGVPAQDL